MSEPSEYDLIGNNALDLMKKTKKKEGRGIWAYSSLETVKKTLVIWLNLNKISI